MSAEQLKKITNTIDKIRALYLLNDKTSVGRKMLSKLLDIGEGYARNIITNLKNSGLIKEDRIGNSLTEKGKKFILKISDYMVPFFDFKIEGFKNSKAVLVKNASKLIKMGIEERDAAIRIGALGALIITYSNGSFWFPGITNLTEDHPEIVEPIKGQINAEENDVIIITWGNSSKDAERGVLNAALEIIDKSGAIQIRKLV